MIDPTNTVFIWIGFFLSLALVGAVVVAGGLL
jgi:hypothetical protein